MPNAGIQPSASFACAIVQKHTIYSELANNNVLRLVVVATEVGLLNSAGCQLSKIATNHRTDREPQILRSPAARKWEF